MGKVINYDAIEAARLTDTGENNDLNYLKSNGPRALPTSPTANNWSAEAIKKQLYKQPEIIFAWVKALGDAVYQFASDVDDVFDDTKADEVVHKTGEETISGKKTFAGGASFTTANVNFGSSGADNSKQLDIYYAANLRGPVTSNIIVPGNTGFSIGTSDNRWHTGYFANLNLSGKIVKGSYEYELPEKSGTVAMTSDITSAIATKADLVNGKVPAEQLPSYVDDVLEYANYSGFPATGEQGKIYVALDTNFTYRWSGTAYVRVNETDLSDYYTKSQTDSAIDADVAALSGQVADGTVVAGKASKDASGNPITSTYATKAESAALDSKISKNAKDIAALTEALIKKDLYETQEATFLGMAAVPAGAMAKAYLDGFKGNSAVVNQLVQLKNNTVSPAGYPISASTTTHKITFSGTATSSDTNTIGVLDHNITFQSGHTYLLSFKVSGTIPAVRLGNFTNIVGNSTTTTTDIFVTAPSDANDVRLIAASVNGTAYSGDLILQCVDCTAVPLTTAEMASVSTAKAALKHKDMDVDSYIPYNAGTLTDSKPTKLISNPYNLSDEEVEGGAYNSITGAKDTGTNNFRSASKAVCQGGVSYTLEWASSLGVSTIVFLYYDKDENYLGIYDLYNVSSATKTMTPPSNARYVAFSFYKSGSGWQANPPTKAEAQLCFHLASANLGYKPYVAPIEYDLTLPTLKSAGSVQDESKAGGMKVKKDDLGDFTFSASGSTWNASLPLAKPTANNQSLPDALCSTYTRDTTSNIIGSTPTNKTFAFSTGSVTMRVYDTSITQASDVQGKINYELAAPTDFTDPISYPEIFDVYAGGSIEVVGDGCDATAKVYFYVEA